MKKYLVVVLFFMGVSSWAQINLSPYKLTLTSDLAFASVQEELDQINLSFHAQEWPLEVLKYVLIRLQQNPYISDGISIQVTLVNTAKTRTTTLKVPVSTFYIKAFRTEEGFNAHYYDFLNETYEWMLEYL